MNLIPFLLHPLYLSFYLSLSSSLDPSTMWVCQALELLPWSFREKGVCQSSAIGLRLGLCMSVCAWNKNDLDGTNGYETRATLPHHFFSHKGFGDCPSVERGAIPVSLGLVVVEHHKYGIKYLLNPKVSMKTNDL